MNKFVLVFIQALTPLVFSCSMQKQYCIVPGQTFTQINDVQIKIEIREISSEDYIKQRGINTLSFKSETLNYYYFSLSYKYEISDVFSQYDIKNLTMASKKPSRLLFGANDGDFGFITAFYKYNNKIESNLYCYVFNIKSLNLEIKLNESEWQYE